MHDPYDVLQVHRRAEHEVIRAAYRALARKYHPDFGGAQARMVALNEAWGVLGDDTQRAIYDASSEAGDAPKQEAEPVPAGPSTNLLRQRDPAPEGDPGTVIDFGRYSGWRVGDLANHDPDYLEWLARAPIGRRLATEIGSALAQRAAVAATIAPSKAPARRRRRWA